MKICYEWLQEYIDLSDYTPAALGELLTMKTCEIEGVHPFLPELSQVKIGRVEKIEPHPDADKLVICLVNHGDSSCTIVTGAPNVNEGALYPVALPGITIPTGLTLKKAKLRGVESSGMLCSKGELHLEELQDDAHSEDGLWELPADAKIGSSLADHFHFKATILEVDNKSITHRPDLWSHFGFAREIAALLKKPLKRLPTEYKNEGDNYSGPKLEIRNDSALAYSAGIIESIRVQPSFFDQQFRLLAVGMRPINNVVDASNLTMLDIGQPNHPFDSQKINDLVSVGLSKGQEVVRTLDEVDRKIPADIPLIFNGKEPVAVAGVMGGSLTEVSENTESLFFESATFYRKHIRQAVTSLGLRTEASARFEKGQSPKLTPLAYERFKEYLAVTCSNLKASKLETIENESIKNNSILVRPEFIRQKLGNDISDDEIRDILTSLNFAVSKDWEITVPDYRSYFDVTIPEDIVEEIGRVLGYGSIELKPFQVACEIPRYRNRIREVEHYVRDKFTKKYSFTEVHNYAFASDEQNKIDQRLTPKTPRLKNPMQDGMNSLKNSMLPHLLNNIAGNFRSVSNARFFEVDRIFKDTTDLLPEERLIAAGITLAPRSENTESWHSLRALLYDFLVEYGVDKAHIELLNTDIDFFHPGRQGVMQVSNLRVHYGLIHPKLLSNYKLQDLEIGYFDFEIEALTELDATIGAKYKPVFKYPGSTFEFTVLMPKSQAYSELAEAVGKPKAPKNDQDTFIQKVTHLDTYTGENVQEGYKAVSVAVHWRNASRTLKPDEIKTLQEKTVRKLQYTGFDLKT